MESFISTARGFGGCGEGASGPGRELLVDKSRVEKHNSKKSLLKEISVGNSKVVCFYFFTLF